MNSPISWAPSDRTASSGRRRSNASARATPRLRSRLRKNPTVGLRHASPRRAGSHAVPIFGRLPLAADFLSPMALPDDRDRRKLIQPLWLVRQSWCRMVGVAHDHLPSSERRSCRKPNGAKGLRQIFGAPRLKATNLMRRLQRLHRISTKCRNLHEARV